MIIPSHLSPSTINSFIERRSEWYMNKVAKVTKFKTTDYLQRGKGVEAALQHWLETRNFDEAVKVGVSELFDFPDGELQGEELEKLHAHKEDLPKYLGKAIEVYSGYLGFRKAQHKIEVLVEGCTIPIIGYIDFLFSGFWTDLKVLSRKPSGLSQGYMIQGAVYYLATGLPGTFTCLVKNNPKSGPVFHCYEEVLSQQKRSIEYYVEYIKLACRAIEGVYKSVHNGDTDALVKHMSFPSLESFYSEKDADAALAYWRQDS